MKVSSFSKANINATRTASCKTGNRYVVPGPLTIIYPVGGVYHIETASERHLRETCQQVALARAASGVSDAGSSIGTLAGAAAKAATAAKALAKATKSKRKTAKLVASVATRTSGKRAPRSVASKANDARYQWLKRRLVKAGVNTITVRGGSVRAAMELQWQAIVLSA